MVKVTELVAGFMLLVVVNARLIPSFLWIGAIVFVLTAYLGYAYWDKYKSIFSRN
jgi:hypothetical protein